MGFRRDRHLSNSVHKNTSLANHFFLKQPPCTRLLKQSLTFQRFCFKEPPIPGSSDFRYGNPQAGNFRLCGVSSVEPGKLSLPSFLYGNPWFRVTPSFFRLSHLQPSASHAAERRQPFERQDASPLPLSRTLTPISWLALLAHNFVAPPCPHSPQWGLRSNPKLSAP